MMRCGANYATQIRDELAGDIKSTKASHASSSATITSTSCTTAPTQLLSTVDTHYQWLFVVWHAPASKHSSPERWRLRHIGMNVCLWRNNFTVARFRESWSKCTCMEHFLAFHTHENRHKEDIKWRNSSWINIGVSAGGSWCIFRSTIVHINLR